MDLKKNKVEDTNDCSIVSKYSMCKKGYAFDDYIKYFVSESQQKRIRSPLISRGYYIRFKAIDYLFNRYKHLNQIISIGCGFDTSSLRYSSIRFIEIDFPFVALNKAKIIINNKLIDFNPEKDFYRNEINEIMDNNKPYIILRTDSYCLIGTDLRKYDNISKLFVGENLLKNVNELTKIGLFNECSLCYIQQSISDNLIEMFYNLYKNKCHSISYIGYEQIKTDESNDGFSSIMLNHFKTIGSPLMTFLTKSQINQRFKALNFNFVEVLDMKIFYDKYIDDMEKKRIDGLEPFDELEEFDLLCNCYALTMAETNFKTVDKIVAKIDSTKTFSEIKALKIGINESELLSRFGHTTCLTKDNKVVIFGGFGCDFTDKKHGNNKISHKRLSNLITINTETNKLNNYMDSDKSNSNGRIHSNITQLESDLFFISGGRSSPSVILNNQLIKLSSSGSYGTLAMPDSQVIPPKVFRHLLLKMIDSNEIIQLGGKGLKEDNYYHVLDAITLKWQKRFIRNNLLDIHSHSGTSLNRNVFLFNGGLNCNTYTYNSPEIHLIDNRMESVSNIKVNDLKPLYSHKIKSLSENKVLIIGGISKSGINNKIDLLDLRSNTITDSMNITSDSPLMLHNFCSELIQTNNSGLLWVIGGGGNCFSFGTHFNQLSIVKIL